MMLMKEIDMKMEKREIIQIYIEFHSTIEDSDILKVVSFECA